MHPQFETDRPTGRIDFVETAWLMKAIHRDEDSIGDDFKALVARLCNLRDCLA